MESLGIISVMKTISAVKLQLDICDVYIVIYNLEFCANATPMWDYVSKISDFVFEYGTFMRGAILSHGTVY
jgi:hypothetical protein